jgi:hypothetical protein
MFSLPFSEIKNAKLVYFHFLSTKKVSSTAKPTFGLKYTQQNIVRHYILSLWDHRIISQVAQLQCTHERSTQTLVPFYLTFTTAKKLAFETFQITLNIVFM